MRFLNRLYAFLFGYFWVPCPRCGKYFGGHEWSNQDGLPTNRDVYEGICNNCAQKRANLGITSYTPLSEE